MNQATSTEPATFGEMLRFLRHRMQMTQQQLGAALGYSAAMVARLESDERLPDLALVKTAYVEALGLEREPELAAQLVALAERARGDGHAVPPTPAEIRDAVRTNLPRQLTPFIGRAGEVAEVSACWPATRW